MMHYDSYVHLILPLTGDLNLNQVRLIALLEKARIHNLESNEIAFSGDAVQSGMVEDTVGPNKPETKGQGDFMVKEKISGRNRDCPDSESEEHAIGDCEDRMPVHDEQVFNNTDQSSWIARPLQSLSLHECCMINTWPELYAW